MVYASLPNFVRRIGRPRISRPDQDCEPDQVSDGPAAAGTGRVSCIAGIVDMSHAVFVQPEDVDELVARPDVLRGEGLARMHHLGRSLVEAVDADDEIDLAGQQVGVGDRRRSGSPCRSDETASSSARTSDSRCVISRIGWNPTKRRPSAVSDRAEHPQLCRRLAMKLLRALAMRKISVGTPS